MTDAPCLGLCCYGFKAKTHNYWGWGGRYKQRNSVLAHSIEIVYLEGKTILCFPSTPC